MHCPVLTAFYICNIVLLKAYVNASSPHLIPDLRLNTVSEQSKITYIISRLLNHHSLLWLHMQKHSICLREIYI